MLVINPLIFLARRRRTLQNPKELMNKRRNAFTLVELLVVLAIIAILAAILFPAFNRAKESARQTNCASNLQQIGFAVIQYRKDEGRYPDTLVDILGEGTKVADPGLAGDFKLDGKATGYLKGSQDRLICQSDDTLVVGNGARSSYGSLSKSAPAVLVNPTTKDMTDDFGKYVWNYWGYRADGFAYQQPNEVVAAFSASPANALPVELVLPSQPYNPRFNGSLLNTATPENPFKYSLSNRNAPPTTIITHCVYHRLQTGNSLNTPGDLYVVDPGVDGSNTRDIILLLDGSTKTIDVSQSKTQKTWQNQTP